MSLQVPSLDVHVFSSSVATQSVEISFGMNAISRTVIFFFRARHRDRWGRLATPSRIIQVQVGCHATRQNKMH